MTATLRPAWRSRWRATCARAARGGLAIVHLHAVADPLRPALVCGETRLNYGELEERINRLTHGLRAARHRTGRADRRLPAQLRRVRRAERGARRRWAACRCRSATGSRRPRWPTCWRTRARAALLFHADLAPIVEEALTLGGRERGAHRARALHRRRAARRVSARYEDLLHAPGVDPREPAHRRRRRLRRRDGLHLGHDRQGQGRDAATSARRAWSRCSTSCRSSRSRATSATWWCVRSTTRWRRRSSTHGAGRRRLRGDRAALRARGGAAHHRARAHHLADDGADDAARLRRSSPPEVLRRYDISSLRWIMSGAAPLPTDLARRVEETFGPILYNFYGATETGLVTIAKPGEHTARPGTIGRLHRAATRSACSTATGDEVADGQVGELYVAQRHARWTATTATTRPPREAMPRGLLLRRRSGAARRGRLLLPRRSQDATW